MSPRSSDNSSRSNRSNSRPKPTGPEQGGGTETAESREKKAVGSFLRGLARRAEADATFAVHIHNALEESGLLRPHEPAGRKQGGRQEGRKEETPTTLPDPFQVFREQGEKELRETLERKDLEELHVIVRRYRLDPARISSRWTRKERVIDLIVDQVLAYARHGQAFSRL